MELLLVVIILGLLAIVTVPRLASTAGDSAANTCRQNIAIINSQIELWAAQNDSCYPKTHDEFVENILKNQDIFPGKAPACPYGEAYKYDPAKTRVVPHNHNGSGNVTAEQAEGEGAESAEP